VNNCVGVGNLKFFLLFCLYTCLASSFIFAVVVSRLASCSSPSVSLCFDTNLSGLSRADYRLHVAQYSDASAVSFVLIVLLLMECAIFGLFTAAMTITQLQAIAEDETQIEHWQRHSAGNFHNHSNTHPPRQTTIAASARVSTRHPPQQPPQEVQLVSLPVIGNAASPVGIVGGGSSSTPSSSSHMMTVAVPIAQPLPPTTATRARHCRTVFVGSGSSVAAATGGSSRAGGGLLPSALAARWGRFSSLPASHPLGLVLRVLLFVPSLLLACLCTPGSLVNYVLPTPVVHDDYARLCGYRLPRPGMVTRIEVVDPEEQQADAYAQVGGASAAPLSPPLPLPPRPRALPPPPTAYSSQLAHDVATRLAPPPLPARYVGGDEEDGFVRSSSGDTRAYEDRRTV
jgi:hypothetical protein